MVECPPSAFARFEFRNRQCHMATFTEHIIVNIYVWSGGLVLGPPKAALTVLISLFFEIRKRNIKY